MRKKVCGCRKHWRELRQKDNVATHEDSPNQKTNQSRYRWRGFNARWQKLEPQKFESSKVRKFGRKSKKGFLAFVASAVMQKKKLKVCRKWFQTRFRQKAALLKQQWLPGTMTEPQKRNRRNRNDLVPKFFRSSEKIWITRVSWSRKKGDTYQRGERSFKVTPVTVRVVRN